MRMTLHHQKSCTVPGIGKVFAGEDGRPYADDGLLIVADGLGGRGGYPHSKIDPAILNRETFFQTAFPQGFEKADQTFIDFVLDSFSELFALKDRYLTDRAAMRTSGYYASRLVTAIALYELKYNFPQDRRQLFSAIRENGEVSQKKIDRLAEHLGRTIETRLAQAARNMGLELESRTKGSYLLPSTLVIAMTDEYENEVQTLCFWAGDSRTYFWDADGLGVLTDDHEKNETMTNLVTLTQPFRIESRYVVLKKPVALFNATDGCYKCPCFASPLDLEYILLQAWGNADGFEAAARALDGQFRMIGTHDDSNTMALATYGFADYTAFRSAVLARLGDVNDTIVSRLPDIFERDYVSELAAAQENVKNALFTMKDKLFASEKVRTYVLGAVATAHFAPYEAELASLESERLTIEETERETVEKVRKWVEYYWLRAPYLRKIAGVKDVITHPVEKSEELAQSLALNREERVRCAEREAEDLRAAADDFFAMHDLFCDPGSSAADRDRLRTALRGIRSALDVVQDRAEGRTPQDKRYNGDAESRRELIAKYVKGDRADIDRFADDLIRQRRRLGFEMSDQCRSAIESYLDVYNRNAERRAENEARRQDLPAKYMEAFWNDRARELIGKLMEAYPQEITALTESDLAALQSEVHALESSLALREEIYEGYRRAYERQFRESTLIAE